MSKSFDLAGNGEPDQVWLGVRCRQGWASKGLWMNLLGTVNDDHPTDVPHACIIELMVFAISAGLTIVKSILIKPVLPRPGGGFVVAAFKIRLTQRSGAGTGMKVLDSVPAS